MWIRLKDIKISAESLNESEEYSLLMDKLVQNLKTDKDKIDKFIIFRKSPDLREKGRPYFVYTIDAKINNKSLAPHIHKNGKIEIINKIENIYDTHIANMKKIMAKRCNVNSRPVVVGFGPAGMFAALVLTEIGIAPIVLERGEKIEERVETIDKFNKLGKLNTQSNIRFGEGGAGTFSDGKLNSLIKDKDTAGRFVLETFVKFGAPQEILYKNKPHIGTDILRQVIKNIREYIIMKGAELHFNTKMTGFEMQGNKITAVRAETTKDINEDLVFETDTLFMAIGHSSRDTFEYLKNQNVNMEKKPFSVGVRIEHLQSTIDLSQYSTKSDLMRKLNGAADYKLSYQTSNGRGVYTFCMCPGGYVVNASSEEGRLVTNGMSNFARNAKNANSALLVGVTPEDFPENNVLAGMEFQRKIEENAFVAGGKNWKAPCQLVGDFMEGRISTELGKVEPTFSSGYTFAEIDKILPMQISDALKEGIAAFGRKIKGFDACDAVLTGCETRSSSPVRILRDENAESKNIKGLYPVGEGAGYAGGILSAGTDGIKSIEKWLSKM